MPPRRAQAPGARLLPALALLPLLLGAGPQGGCLASPVPTAPLSAPGPCASQPCQNGGVCTPRSVAGQEHPAADAEPGYICTCAAGVSGTDCQLPGNANWGFWGVSCVPGPGSHPIASLVLVNLSSTTKWRAPSGMPRLSTG
ncbi:hypothetical protein ACRRTK_000101 [Alexandromys fortis]